MAENPIGKDVPSAETSQDRSTREALGHVRDALHGLRFGEIRLILQDGVVVQLERTERTRLERRARRG